MKIALTGATGFAGGPILHEILATGHSLSVLVRRPQNGQFEPAVRVIKGDLDDVSAIRDFCVDADVVVHVAGAISALNEAGYFKVNFAGTRNVFEAAIEAGVKRLVFVSSITARNPELSAYAASKRAAEDYLASQKHEIEILTLRPSAIYGPGDKATLPLLAALQKSIATVPGRKCAKFSLVHVQDFARVVAAAANGRQIGMMEIDDMQGGHDWNELAKLNRSISGKPNRVIYLPHALVKTVALVSEFGALLTGQSGMVNRGKVNELYHNDWVARGASWPRENPIGLAEGLAETVTWYRANGWLPPLKQAVKTAP